MTIEVLISKDELKGIHLPSEYILNKLRKNGIPITGFLNLNSSVTKGILRKDVIEEKELVKFTWIE